MARPVSVDIDRSEVVVEVAGHALLVKEIRGEYCILTTNDLTPAAQGLACHIAAQALAEKRKERPPVQLALI